MSKLKKVHYIKNYMLNNDIFIYPSDWIAKPS